MDNVYSINDGFDHALSALKGGGVVAVPTETVYGLAANACNADAVARIYTIKGRPSFNPLIAHVADIDMAQRFAEFNETAVKFADAFWPGALTLVLPLKEGTGIAEAVTAGLDTIALRHPKGTMAKLASVLATPLAAPSANSSGKISPTSPNHVAHDLGDKVDVILDGGRCTVGVESTILKITENGITLLREGGIPLEDLEAIAGPISRKVSDAKLEAPGMMLAHYAPAARLRLNVTDPSPEEALLAFGPVSKSRTAPARSLSETGNLEEAAHNLFALLKELDAYSPDIIAVHPIPEEGIGAAINDRLTRAAHGNSAL